MTQPCLVKSTALPKLLAVAVLMLLSIADTQAARIGELADNNVLDQAIRFFSFRDPTVRMALIGCLLLGLCCGLLGTFIVVRQFALVGDTLAHAVLPGIALGYLWTLSKSPLHLFIGAVVAGVAGAAVVSLVQQTTRLKRDTALGIVLGGFYGVGILLVTMIQRLPGEKSGLKSFLFGSAAALSEADLFLIATISVLSLLIVGLLFNQFKATSFDPGFARSIGIPSQFFHYLLMLLLAWAVVSALQAVGVVLVSAMLIIPAATAYLLTDRLHHMLIISVVVGMVSAGLGAFFSFLGPSLPTGPFIILSAAVIFGLAFGFSPRHGVFPRWKRHRQQRHRIQRENTLKALFHGLESGDFSSKWVTESELAERRRRSPEETKQDIAALERHELAELDAAGSRVRLTKRGFERASKIVRNHRLWELYLTNAANIAPDHVHEDAEIIEHILGEEIVRELEKALDQPTTDPHGKAIPHSALIDCAAMDLIPPFDLKLFLTEPWSQWQIETTLRIVALAFCVSASCGLVGVYLILRRMALVGDAISHSVLPGIVVAAWIAHSLTGPAIILGALTAGFITTLLIEWIHKYSRVKSDAAIGIVFAAMFALGVVMVTKFSGNLHIDTDCVLFGKIEEVAVTPGIPASLIQGVLVLLLTIGAIVFFYKELLVSAFDPGLARSLGIRAGWIHYGLMAWLSVVVVTAFEAVGSIIVVAMLIIPGATALLLTDRLSKALILTVLHALVSTVLGYHLGLWLDSNLPAAMVVAGLGLFVLAWFFSPTQGLVSIWVNRRRLREQLENGTQESTPGVFS